jgi:hypothetical protein
MKMTTRRFRVVLVAMISSLLATATTAEATGGEKSFRRIATFPVFQNTDIETETVAEIVVATDDGMTLIYTDSENEALGFVDLTDPTSPQPLGVLDLPGEPTSVAVAGNYALVAVNTSSGDPIVTPNFVEVPRSGELLAVDLTSRAVVRSWPLPGQPDSVAVGPEARGFFGTRYAAIAIESEREEDGVCLIDGLFEALGEDDCEDAGGFVGPLPQSPAGSLVILDIRGGVDHWTTRTVDLTGLADLFPSDPEPEYVAINKFNIAAVTLQENNQIISVYLPTGRVFSNYSAGTVDLDEIDIEDDGLIQFSSSLSDVPREPDGATFVNAFQLATADEGDYVGGGRGFTIYDLFTGRVAFTAGNSVDHATARVGHYPEGRSDNKGNEPENVAYGRFGTERYLFVGSERSSLVLVYVLPRPFVMQHRNRSHPQLVQVLPTQVAPEGLLALPERNLLVVASEADDRGDKFRSSLNVYELGPGEPTYPTIQSADRPDGTPIPWAALSALAVDPADPETVYSVYDGFFNASRIFVADRSSQPAVIEDEIVLHDSAGLVQAVEDETRQFFEDNGLVGTVEGFVDLVNDDGTVNLDPEGLTIRPGGGFYLASEGSGAVGDTGRDFSPNLILGVTATGEIDEAITLPGALANTEQRRFGFEGVAAVEENGVTALYVAFQRAWTAAGDTTARIGRYANGGWTFAYYPLDAPTSPNGGWVGLSEIVDLGDGEFAVVERDNQGGPDARIKTIQSFSIDGVTFKPAEDVATFETVSKTLLRDLVPDLEVPAGAIIEKVEGLAALPDGVALVATDNDGVDDSNGETQYLEIPGVF